jgi:hypothetical protein
MSVSIDDLITRVRSVGKDLLAKAAPDIAVAVQEDLQRTITAGTSPDGEQWAPRKSDGSKPLQHAADQLGVAAVGTTVYVRLAGPAVRHNFGRARGKVVRQVIPQNKLPDAMRAAIGEVITKHFGAIING